MPKIVWIIKGCLCFQQLIDATAACIKHSHFTSRHSGRKEGVVMNNTNTFVPPFLWLTSSERHLLSSVCFFCQTGRCPLRAAKVPVPVSSPADSQSLTQVQDDSRISHGKNNKLLKALSDILALYSNFPSACGQQWNVCNRTFLSYFVKLAL